MTDALMPVRHSGVFKCPRCNVVAEQHWFTVRYEDREGKAEYYWGDGDYLAVNQCKNCSQMSLWMGSALIWPETTTAPSPNADMPEEVARFYAEASSVLQHSPRSAAALLRLSMQTLLRGLGLKGDLNAMIGTLVERGLPLAIQQAMSYGLPIIAGIGDGTQSDLVRSENGWQLSTHTVEELTEVLASALKDPEMLRRMGEFSFEIVKNEVNLEAMVETFANAVEFAMKLDKQK